MLDMYKAGWKKRASCDCTTQVIDWGWERKKHMDFLFYSSEPSRGINKETKPKTKHQKTSK